MSLAIDARVLPRWRTLVVAERLALAMAMFAAALLRTIAVFHYRIDSDEPQHLHVIWGWTHGLLQYRDLFDNHMPLFQILYAPLLRMVGERADALIAMRLAVLPLYALMLALTYHIALACYPRRIAQWSTVVTALFPLFLLGTTEFRTDDLWSVFWLASIAILVRGTLTNARVAAGGFALGMAAAVSAKTTLLLLAICVGAGVVARISRAGGHRPLRCVVIFLAAFAIPPAAIALYFAARGAWQPFLYGVITHNIVHHFRTARLILLPGLLLLIAILARRVADSPRRLFLFVTAHFYAAALYCLWPLVEHEHWLPYFPLAVVTLLPMFFTYRRVVAIAAVEITLVIVAGTLWRDNTREGLAVVEQTLQLTTPGESVMDLKGETVFRPRAFFYVIEPLTKHRIHSGRIGDTIVSDILRARTMVVAEDHYNFPRLARKFLRRNFISVGAVRVAGRILRAGESRFRIDVPAEYAIVGEKNPVAGDIDGQPYDRPRYLAAGAHTINPPPPDRSYALLWSRAAALGFKPSGLAHVVRCKRRFYAQSDHSDRRHSAVRNDGGGHRKASSQVSRSQPNR